MQQLLAIAVLTWKAAFRFRLFLVIAVLLLASVVGLPILIKDDGTARGFTQILLTYTLSTITALLGLSTLWLACGTLARDIEECPMQMVTVKPIARWEVWWGNWLGLQALNGSLRTWSGGSGWCRLEWGGAGVQCAAHGGGPTASHRHHLLDRGASRFPEWRNQLRLFATAVAWGRRGRQGSWPFCRLNR